MSPTRRGRLTSRHRAPCVTMGRMEPTDKAAEHPEPADAPVPPRNRRERRAAKKAGQADMRAVRMHTGHRFRAS